MKTSRKGTGALGLLMLVAAACGAPNPDNTPGRELERTSSSTTTIETTARPVFESTSSGPPSIEPPTSGLESELDAPPVDLDGLLSQLDQLLDDLDSSLEGVPQS